MTEIISFAARVKNVVSECSKDYKDFFVDYDYLVCSKGFKQRPYYIIVADKNNYKHLTGIQSPLSPDEFFQKCFNDTLDETEISFIKDGQTENEVKGSIRRKISVLPLITSVFSQDTLVEEDYSKNRIRCSFAAGMEKFTLGFTLASPNTRPMTLLKGKVIDNSKSKPIDLVLRRPTGSLYFDTLYYGNIDTLKEYCNSFMRLLSEELKIALDNEEN